MAALLLAWPSAGPAGSSPGVAAQADPAQEDMGYGLVAEWPGFPGVTRVLFGPDETVNLLSGGRVRKLDDSGAVTLDWTASGANDFAFDNRGAFYGLRGETIFKYDGARTLWNWSFESNFYHPEFGYRKAFASAIAFNHYTERTMVVWDGGGGDGTEVVLTGFNPAAIRREEFKVRYPRHVYWDADWQGGRAYLLNRSRGHVEVYDTREGLIYDIPVPVAAERVAARTDGSVFVLSDRSWIYQLEVDGGVRDAWDAASPEPGTSPYGLRDLTVGTDGRVYVADAERGTVRIFDLGPVDRGLFSPPSPDPRCQLVPFKTADPIYLQLGEQTQVTLRLDGSCPFLAEKADIAVVVDRSGSMDGDKLIAAREAVEIFAAGMNLERDHMALVTFMSEPQLVVGLTQDRGALITAARNIQAGGGTDIAAGIDTAVTELRRSPRFGDPTVKPIIVLMTDGVPFNNTRMRTVAAADVARYAGITVYSIGLGSDVDPDLLKLVATSPFLYRFAPEASDLRGIYEAIARQIAASFLMEEVTIVDEVPEVMEYQLDSAEPPAAWDPVARTLTWRLRPVPFGGIELRYWLKPLALGRHDTNVRADFDGPDGLGQPQIGPFPVPWVILVGAETPSPTSPPPTATATPRPSFTATATSTMGPSPTVPPTSTRRPSPTAATVETPKAETPTPTPTVSTPPHPTVTNTPRVVEDRIFVPIVFNDKCIQLYTDVTLVIDASTTMLSATPGGESKIEAAQEAALAFIDALQLERDFSNRHDQAAIVWYNDRARVAQTLTNDREALRAAIANIVVDEGSRIDLGLEFAHRELLLGSSSGRIIANAPVIVLLSDGKPNRTSQQAVLDAADAAKRDGITVYTVGHGLVPGMSVNADYWPHVLRRIASQPSLYIHSPTGDDLTEIYREIAGQLICR